MLDLAEEREIESEVVLQHIEIELKAICPANAKYVMRRIAPLIGLAFDAGYDRAQKEASDAAQRVDA